MNTETAEFLSAERSPIVQATEEALARAGARHYTSAGADEVRRRLEALFDHLLNAVATSDLGPMIAYAQAVAEERFQAGYDLVEVQTAFNALEEATWTRVLARLEPAQLANALGLVTTTLGVGKDALAGTYVSLAAHTHAPSLDLRALFAGTEGP